MKIDRNAHKQASVSRPSTDGGRKTSTRTPTTPNSTKELTCSAVPLAREPVKYYNYIITNEIFSQLNSFRITNRDGSFHS